MTNRLIRASLLFLLATLAACSGGGGGGGGGGGAAPPGGATSYTIGGSVSGLTGSVVLQNNGGDNLTVSAIGGFTFATAVANGSLYDVTVLTQPSGQTCSVSTGAGTVSGANVTNAVVICAANTFTVSGTASGLTGSVVLQNNNSNNLTVSANGPFTFTAPVASSSPYSVTILTQPAGLTCSVANGTGTITANVTNVVITCAANTYTIGGTASGLSGNVVLQNNAGNNLTVSVNGSFTFSTALNTSAAYAVTVLTQPAGQTCSVGNGSGTVAGANVTNVVVSCVTSPVPRFAYVANPRDNTVSFYTVNAATGQLRHNGYIAAGTYPISVTVDPAGKFAYVVNQTSNTVSAYTINASTGALTAVTGSPFATGTSPQSVTVDPLGKFAYVATFGSGVSAYTINATGALSVIATVTAGTNPVSVTVDPSGKFAYVVNRPWLNMNTSLS